MTVHPPPVAVILACHRSDQTRLAWELAAAGWRLVLSGDDLNAGHRLVLALNTGNAGIAVFLPSDGLADDALRRLAEAEARSAWGDCNAVHI